MKHIYSFLSLGLSLLMSCSLYSCSDDDEPVSNPMKYELMEGHVRTLQPEIHYQDIPLICQIQLSVDITAELKEKLGTMKKIYYTCREECPDSGMLSGITSMAGIPFIYPNDRENKDRYPYTIHDFRLYIPHVAGNYRVALNICQTETHTHYITHDFILTVEDNGEKGWSVTVEDTGKHPEISEDEICNIWF